MAKENVEIEVTGFQSLRAQLKEANMEVQKMVALFGETSPQVAAAAQRAAELKDQMDDANDAVRAFTGAGKFEAFGKAIQGIAGGFTAVQGAMGLLGVESKDLEKTMLKVQSALALTQGLAALEDVGRAFGTLKSVAVNTFNSIKTAIGSSGIGLLLVGLSAAVAYFSSELNKNAEAEKKNKREAEGLENSLKDLERQYEVLNRTIQDNTEIAVANAELAGKSEKDIYEIRKKSYADQKKALNDLFIANSNHFDRLYQLNNQTEQSMEEHGKRYQEIKAQETAAQQKVTDDLAKLTTAATLLDINYQKGVQERSKKAGEDAAATNKQRVNNEKQSLYELNEARRELYLTNEKDERAIVERKYTNQLERLKEQREKELAEENLTENARKNIKQKYNYEEQTARIERDRAIEELDKKAKADAEARQKAHEDKIREIQERRYARSVKIIDDYFAYQRIALDESDLNNYEYNKKQEELELKRLEKQLALAEKAGEDTTALEEQIAAQKKKIRDKDVTDAQSRNQALLSAAGELVGALQSLSQSQMTKELAAAKDNAQKQEEIKKEYFQKDKNFQYAKTTIAGIQAGMQAFAQGMEIGGPVLAGILLAASAATTLVQLAAIMNTQYVGGSTSGSASSGTSSGRGAGSQYEEGGLLMGPSHDMGGIRTTLGELEGGEYVVNKRSTESFLPLLTAINSVGNRKFENGGMMANMDTLQTLMASQQPSIIKTYVVASEMTSQQEADKRLQDLAKI